jgi:hypothetical protein
MAIMDERRKLFAFEVFYPNVTDSFYRAHCPVVALNYLLDLGALAVITHDGQITFVPHVVERPVIDTA